jgi:hypothetical protein
MPSTPKERTVVIVEELRTVFVEKDDTPFDRYIYITK